MNRYFDKHFLIVDDVELVRKAVRDGLYKLGYKNVTVTASAQEAIKTLENGPIDCILSDWSMPGTTGLELLRFVKASEAYKHIRFMLITGLGDRDSVNLAIAEGVDQFLVKPFNQKRLEKKVRLMLGSAVNVPGRVTHLGNKNEEENGQESALNEATVSSNANNKPLVLIVDDISSNLDVMVGMLKNDYKIKATKSGAGAIKICQSDTPPDLILLDVMMPEMDGFEVCRRLQADPNTQYIPIIFLTAKAETVDITKGFALGAVDYITKPPQPEVLKARVATHLSLKRSRDELAERLDTILENARLREDIEHMTRHDLKNPLSAIISIADTLIEDRWLAVEQKLKVEDIRSSTYKVVNMINRSLDLYKMEMGNYQLEAQPFNVVNTLLEVVNDARANAQKDYIKVHYAAPDNAQVLGEEVLSFTLLSNLIRNAVEASSSQDTVNVGLKEQGDKVVITIRNEGVIAAEIRDSIFEKHATFGKKGGTGLGTYSAKLMAKVQHGDIDFISSQETGTIFRITLPKAPTQA